MDKVQELAKSIQEDVTALRRDIHRHPELGMQETRTTALIREELRRYGVDEILEPLETGTIAVIHGKKGPGRTVGLRADIDALNVPEATGLPFSSEADGVMHACGHDLHTSMMLGNARILCALREEFAGTVKLIFEPSEEKQPGGARALIASGMLDDVDAFFGMHVYPTETEELGKIALYKGPVTTAADEVYIAVHGKAAHGAAPQDGNDAVLAACQLNVLFQQVQARNVDPLQACIFTMNRIEGGINTHTIAGECRIEGSMRVYSQSLREQVKERIHAICRGVEQISGCTIEEDIGNGYDVCVNDEALVDMLTAAYDEHLGPDSYYMMKQPQGFSEDFSFFSTVTGKPAVLMFLNAGHAEGLPVSSLHAPNCSFDEAAIPYGMTAMSHAALAYLADRD